MFPNNLRHVKPHDEVAVMPMGGDAPQYVLKIARVWHVGHAFIHTHDGGMFVASDGGDFNLGRTLYIELATNEHRLALHHKQVFAGQ